MIPFAANLSTLVFTFTNFLITFSSSSFHPNIFLTSLPEALAFVRKPSLLGQTFAWLTAVYLDVKNFSGSICCMSRKTRMFDRCSGSFENRFLRGFIRPALASASYNLCSRLRWRLHRGSFNSLHNLPNTILPDDTHREIIPSEQCKLAADDRIHVKFKCFSRMQPKKEFVLNWILLGSQGWKMLFCISWQVVLPSLPEIARNGRLKFDISVISWIPANHEDLSQTGYLFRCQRLSPNEIRRSSK